MFSCARHRFDCLSLSKSAIDVKTQGGVEGNFVVVKCRACKDPSCARVCPTGALKPKRGGGVNFDCAKCTGCGHCRDACLVGCVFWDDEINKPMICSHCGYCAKFCPHGVLLAGQKEGSHA